MGRRAEDKTVAVAFCGTPCTVHVLPGSSLSSVPVGDTRASDAMPCWTRLLAYAPALWLVWYAHMAEAACPAGVSAPSVTTIMASPTDPEMTALEVTPDCQVTTYSVKPGEGDNSSLLMINKSPARRVASLPTAAQVVFVTSSMVDDVEGLVVPKAVKTLYMFGNQLTSVKNIRLQSGLENLGLSKNQLQSIDFDIPDTLQILNLEGNAFRSIRGVKFPNSLSTIFLESNGISSIEGVRWPASLKTLELTGNTVTNFEVQKSDMSFLPDVTVSTVKPSPIRQRSCTDPTAELVSAFGSNLCVISDQRFKLKYDTSVGVSGASSGSNADKADGSTDASPSPSTTKSPASASASPSSSSQDTDSSQHTSDASMTAGSGSMFPATKIASGSRSAPADVINTPSANKNGSENAIDGTRGTPSTIVTSTRSDSLVMILAVVVGVIVVVIAAIVYWICRRRKRPQNMKEGGGSYDTYTATETPSASQSQSQSQSQDQDRDHFGDSNTSTHAAFIDHDIRNDKVIMKYRIDKSAILVGKLIARGGYGAIYKGQYDNRDVAIKQMLPGTWHNDAMLSSFMAEIRMCARLDHPKIVSFLGVAWSSLQDLSVIIEYMPGGDLHALLHKQPVPTATRTATRTAAGTGAEAAQTGSEASVGTGPRSQDWTQPWTPHNIKPKTAIAMDIAEAVVYLHSFSSPILHRDLKTRNVLLDRHGNAKLSDFGISRELTLDETMTSEIGTAAWIAPEVLRGERYGEKADIYSLGVVLVELDRCRHPYADEKVLRGESTMAESTATGMAGASGSSRGSGRGSNGGGGGGRQSMSHVAHKNTQIAVLVSTGKLRPSVSACCPETVSSLVSRCLAFDADARPTAMEVYYELRQELKKSLPSFSAT